jgi:hypothetical protein
MCRLEVCHHEKYRNDYLFIASHISIVSELHPLQHKNCPIHLQRIHVQCVPACPLIVARTIHLFHFQQ